MRIDDDARDDEGKDIVNLAGVAVVEAQNQ